MEDSDKIIGELFRAGLCLYFLSIFVSIFDGRVASFLKKIAYLNGISVLFLIFFQLWVLFIKFTNALDKIGNWKPW